MTLFSSGKCHLRSISVTQFQASHIFIEKYEIYTSSTQYYIHRKNKNLQKRKFQKIQVFEDIMNISVLLGRSFIFSYNITQTTISFVIDALSEIKFKSVFFKWKITGLSRGCRCGRPTGTAGCYKNVTVRFFPAKKIKTEQWIAQ